MSKAYYNYDWEYVHRDVPLYQTKEEIQERKGKHHMSRFNYLQALVTEFQESKDEGNKTTN